MTTKTRFRTTTTGIAADVRITMETYKNTGFPHALFPAWVPVLTEICKASRADETKQLMLQTWNSTGIEYPKGDR